MVKSHNTGHIPLITSTVTAAKVSEPDRPCLSAQCHSLLQQKGQNGADSSVRPNLDDRRVRSELYSEEWLGVPTIASGQFLIAIIVVSERNLP